MDVFFWRKTSKRVEVFAVELATDFFSEVSAEALAQYFREDDRGKKGRRGIEAQIHNLVLRLNQFREIHKLGVYGKARFHQSFMARLEELGYDAESTKALNNLLMVRTP